MKIMTAAFVLVAATASATPGIAKNQPKSEAQAAADLRVAVQEVMQAQAVPPGQAKRPVDPDQGDEHASAIAIQKVCSKSTPAAERSAICPVPVSPS